MSLQIAVPYTALRGSSSRWALLVSVLALGASGCADDPRGPANETPDATWVTADEPLTLTSSASPVAGVAAGTTFYGSIAYGTDPQQVFDAFLPASVSPTAAIVYVHGGGFTKGSRTDVYDGSGDAITTVVAAGVAFIGVDYRLLLDLGVESEGVRKCLLDSRRALQFLRFHAAELNVDPRRIAIYGGSAGAGTSVWLAFHDDMAQRTNPDLIARESTRVVAVGANQTQATYDVLRWAPDVFAPQYSIVSNDLLLSIGSALDLLIRFYGLSLEYKTNTTALMELLYGEAWTEARADLDLLALASRDDPPIYLNTSTPDVAPMQMGFDLLHHPLHATTLYEAALDAEISEVEADIPAYEIESSFGGSIDFLLEHL